MSADYRCRSGDNNPQQYNFHVPAAAEKTNWKNQNDKSSTSYKKKLDVPMNVVDVGSSSDVDPPNANAYPTEKNATLALQASNKFLSNVF